MAAAERKTRWMWLTATFFGVGFLKPGPGTYGSAAALLIWYAAADAAQPNFTKLAIATAAAALLLTLIGIPAATRVARESGSKDPGFVVIDEVAGQLVALTVMRPTWKQAALAFILFRAFDILKPPPVRQLERLPEGTGIMLDDIAAGVLAAITGAILVSLAHHLH
jgi:phosphatidylglycerophosphatase A